MIHRTSFITSRRGSWLGWRKERKITFSPYFKLINRTQGWAASVLVLRKAVLKQN